MKCPKCGYLGFETGDRCRNCGYDFSLHPGGVEPGSREGDGDDLPLRLEPDTDGPLTDFSLGTEFDARSGRPVVAPDARPPLDLDQLIGASEPAPARTPPSAGDQRLFPEEHEGRVPRPRAAPRPPLAVRRTTPEVPRASLRHTPRQAREAAFESLPLAGLGLPAGSADRAEEQIEAPPVRRVLAAIIDLTVLGAIDGAVLYFTIRLSGLGVVDLGALPWAPLASFFLLLNGGYFVTFAAVGGQTIGQMALGLKVVGPEGAPVALGAAMLRTAAWLLSTLPLGFGLWFALGSDQRALHDRLTGTRVILS